MNILSNIPKDLPEELIEVLAENDKVRIERIISRGHVSADWYDQDTNEFVLLFKGEAKIFFEEGAKVIHLKTGDHLTIPARARHKVIWTIPNEHTVWMAVHY